MLAGHDIERGQDEGGAADDDIDGVNHDGLRWRMTETWMAWRTAKRSSATLEGRVPLARNLVRRPYKIEGIWGRCSIKVPYKKLSKLAHQTLAAGALV